MHDTSSAIISSSTFCALIDDEQKISEAAIKVEYMIFVDVDFMFIPFKWLEVFFRLDSILVHLQFKLLIDIVKRGSYLLIKSIDQVFLRNIVNKGLYS